MHIYSISYVLGGSKFRNVLCLVVFDVCMPRQGRGDRVKLGVCSNLRTRRSGPIQLFDLLKRPRRDLLVALLGLCVCIIHRSLPCIHALGRAAALTFMFRYCSVVV